MKSSDEPIQLEYIYKTSNTKAWKAISDPEEMKRWYFDNIVDFHPEVGFETKFVVQSGGRTFTHCWKVTEVIPNQKIAYSWKYIEYPGDSVVSFELIREEDLVKLRLIVNVLEDFPVDIPEFKRESCIAGWNYFLGGNLKAYLET